MNFALPSASASAFRSPYKPLAGGFSSVGLIEFLPVKPLAAFDLRASARG
jgi:hypothetical protein